MKHYTIDYIPLELRGDDIDSASYSIFDNELLESVATLFVERYAEEYQILLSGTESRQTFPSLRSALASIDANVYDFDYPDELYEQLSLSERING